MRLVTDDARLVAADLLGCFQAVVGRAEEAAGGSEVLRTEVHLQRLLAKPAECQLAAGAHRDPEGDGRVQRGGGGGGGGGERQ